MELYIIRHGQTVWNTEKRLQGSTDIELNEEGIRLAKETGKALADVKIDRIFSSPLKRAYITATYIKGDRSLDIETDDRIRELCFGSYEGQRKADLDELPGCTFKYFFTDPALYQPPADGETLEHLCKRGGEFLREKILPLENECDRVVIVAHGAMNRALMANIKGIGIEQFWSGGLLKNCGASIVELKNGQFTVKEDNMVFYRE